jgi:peptidoglycan/LPS O-acetylase OafA/YrhL
VVSRIPTLDGWRAIAVLLVVWAHAGLEFNSDGTAASHYGAFGVDIFFAISGLLITTLLIDEHRRTGGISLVGFYIRRAFRILPPAFAYLLAAGLTVGFVSGRELAAAVLFFRNYLVETAGGHYTSHLWSLAVEEHFYLTWPALVIVLLARKTEPAVVAWLAIAIGLWRVAETANGWTGQMLPGVVPHYRTDLRMDALLWGCFAAFLMAQPSVRETLAGKMRGWHFGLGLAVATVCAVLHSTLTLLLLPMILPLLLAATIAHPHWAVSRLLETRAFGWVGRMSYSIYLWQQLFLVPGWNHPAWIQQFPQNLPCAFLMAFLSYRFLEKPCMNYGRKLSALAAKEKKHIPEPALVTN